MARKGWDSQGVAQSVEAIARMAKGQLGLRELVGSREDSLGALYKALDIVKTVQGLGGSEKFKKALQRDWRRRGGRGGQNVNLIWLLRESYADPELVEKLGMIDLSPFSSVDQLMKELDSENASHQDVFDIQEALAFGNETTRILDAGRGDLGAEEGASGVEKKLGEKGEALAEQRGKVEDFEPVTPLFDPLFDGEVEMLGKKGKSVILGRPQEGQNNFVMCSGFPSFITKEIGEFFVSQLAKYGAVRSFELLNFEDATAFDERRLHTKAAAVPSGNGSFDFTFDDGMVDFLLPGRAPRANERAQKPEHASKDQLSSKLTKIDQIRQDPETRRKALEAALKKKEQNTALVVEFETREQKMRFLTDDVRAMGIHFKGARISFENCDFVRSLVLKNFRNGMLFGELLPQINRLLTGTGLPPFASKGPQLDNSEIVSVVLRFSTFEEMLSAFKTLNSGEMFGRRIRAMVSTSRLRFVNDKSFEFFEEEESLVKHRIDKNQAELNRVSKSVTQRIIEALGTVEPNQLDEFVYRGANFITDERKAVEAMKVTPN